MDQLDDIVKSAMQALGATTPPAYFDELPSRIEARLEGSMHTDSDRNVEQASLIPPSHPSIDPEVRSLVADGRDEDSGLHDIKALARTAKQRVSRRITTQHDVEDQLLSASQSGLHAVALPDPARMVSLPSLDETRAMARSTSGGPDALATAGAAAVSTAHEPREARRGVPAWLWAGGGVAAAAAAVFAFINFGGGKDGPGSHAAQPEASAPAHAEPTVATGAVAQPAVAPAAPVRGDGVAVSGVVDDQADLSAPPPPEEAVEVAVAEPRRDKDAAGRDEGSGSVKGDGVSLVKPDSPAGGSAGKPDKTKVDKPAKVDKTVKVDKGEPKAETKPDGKKSGGAVLGAGDADELGIGDALAGGGKKVEKPSKTELTSRELRAGLVAVSGKAKACFGAHGVAGTVKVKLSVDPGGAVSKASATGEFSGTPTGDCVAAALKTASFPAWDGAPMSTTYAVLLSE